MPLIAAAVDQATPHAAAASGAQSNLALALSAAFHVKSHRLRLSSVGAQAGGGHGQGIAAREALNASASIVRLGMLPVCMHSRGFIIMCTL